VKQYSLGFDVIFGRSVVITFAIIGAGDIIIAFPRLEMIFAARLNSDGEGFGVIGYSLIIIAFKRISRPDAIKKISHLGMILIQFIHSDCQGAF